MTMLRTLILLSLGLNACGTTAPQGKRVIKRTPLEIAVAATKAEVISSVSEGVEESEDRDQFRLRVRYNPGRCEAPAYEVLLKGRWRRAFLETSSVPVRTALDTLSQDESVLSGLWVMAKPTATTRLSSTRVPWPVVEVFALEPSEQSPAKPVAQRRSRKRPCT